MNKFYRSAELRTGVTAEFVVLDFLRENNILDDNDYDYSIVYPTERKPYDIHCECDDASSTIEVKAAKKLPQWKTFFAEVVQTKSKTYPEYLVTPPDHMVYVDTVGKELYLYDGVIFADAVKRRYWQKMPNKARTSEGIKFYTQSVEFGFISKHGCEEQFENVRSDYTQDIKNRLLASKDVPYREGNKECDGLPSLRKPILLEQ